MTVFTKKTKQATFPSFDLMPSFQSVLSLKSCFLCVVSVTDEPPQEDDDIDEKFESSEDPTPKSFEANSELMAELNENLTISCLGLPNATMYQVIMEKMVPSRPWRIIGVCKRVEGGLISEDYSDRGSIRCADTLDISLDLIHVQQEDSGFYRCIFSTDTGVHNTTMTLTVSDPGVCYCNQHTEVLAT